jgi:hypothetical protein
MSIILSGGANLGDGYTTLAYVPPVIAIITSPTSPVLAFTLTDTANNNSFLAAGNTAGACCCSSNGQYIYVMHTTTSAYRLMNVVISSDYGATFSPYVATFNPVIPNPQYGLRAVVEKRWGAGSYGNHKTNVCCTPDGQFSFCWSNDTVLFASGNFGVTYNVIDNTPPVAGAQSITCSGNTSTGNVRIYMSFYDESIYVGSVSVSVFFGQYFVSISWSQLNITPGQMLGIITNTNRTNMYIYRYDYNGGSEMYLGNAPFTISNFFGTVTTTLVPVSATNTNNFYYTMSNDGTIFASALGNNKGILYTTDSNTNLKNYSDTSLNSVSISGDGKKWLFSGTTGLSYFKGDKFSALAKTDSTAPILFASTPTNVGMILLSSDGTKYFAFTPTQIYVGTFN